MRSRAPGSRAGRLEAGATGLRLLAGLPRFLRQGITTELAAARLRTRLAGRGDALVAAIHRASQAQATPYPALLRSAGVTPADAERWVRRHGVEHALAELLAHEVFLSVEELAGRRPVTRRGQVLWDGAPGLAGGARRAGPWTSSSASRGRARIVPVDFEFLAERAASDRLFLEVRGALGWEHAVWETPGGGLLTVLRYARSGVTPRRSFSPIDPQSPAPGGALPLEPLVRETGASLTRARLPRPRGRACRELRARARLVAGSARPGWHASSGHLRDPGAQTRDRGSGERDGPLGGQAHGGGRASHPGSAPDHRKQRRRGRANLPDRGGRRHRLRLPVAGGGRRGPRRPRPGRGDPRLAPEPRWRPSPGAVRDVAPPTRAHDALECRARGPRDDRAARVWLLRRRRLGGLSTCAASWAWTS